MIRYGRFYLHFRRDASGCEMESMLRTGVGLGSPVNQLEGRKSVYITNSGTFDDGLEVLHKRKAPFDAYFPVTNG